jgi:hypothetical protein
MINKMEKEFIRVRSIKDIVIFVSLIVAGSVLIALPTGAAVNITGFFLIFAGLILALAMKTGHKDPSTGETFMKKELYFQQTQHAAIMSAIAAKPESVDMREAEKGNSLKLDIYYRKPSGKAYLQLSEYVPYKYEPCSKVYEHELCKVEKLIK